MHKLGSDGHLCQYLSCGVQMRGGDFPQVSVNRRNDRLRLVNTLNGDRRISRRLGEIE